MSKTTPVRNLFQNNRFSRYSNGREKEMDQIKIEGKIEFDVVEQTPERVVSEMPIQPGMLNPYGVVNGGAT